jgi:hypothetical protein
MSGTLTGENDVRYSQCTRGSQSVSCNSLGVPDYNQDYTFPVTLSGTYDAATNSASGTWTVSPIVRPTEGDWTVAGAPPQQPTTAPTANPLPPPLTATPIATAAAPGQVLVSDTFDRGDAGPCGLGMANNALGGNLQLYLLPIFPTGPEPTPLGANLVSGGLENNGLDYGGFQFAESDPCASSRGFIRGADMGQDLNIRAEILVPSNAAGLITQAGPYVRSRAAALADGIIGGESAGYWLQLESTGEVKIKRLNPHAVIAFSGIPANFDAAAFHTVELAAGDDRLQVAVDGKLQTFNQDGQFTTVVSIPATGGSNNGTAGIAFAAEPNRGQLGGQRVDNLLVTAYRALDDLPVQNNFAASAEPTATGTVPPSDQATSVPPNSPEATTISTNPTGAAAGPTQTGAAAPTLAANVLRGDCNSDARLTEVDALCALQMSVRLIGVNLVMDMDGNGVIDSRDASLILQQAVGN